MKEYSLCEEVKEEDTYLLLSKLIIFNQERNVHVLLPTLSKIIII